jgi:hypothetical protein
VEGPTIIFNVLLDRRAVCEGPLLVVLVRGVVVYFNVDCLARFCILVVFFNELCLSKAPRFLSCLAVCSGPHLTKLKKATAPRLLQDPCTSKERLENLQ